MLSSTLPWMPDANSTVAALASSPNSQTSSPSRQQWPSPSKPGRPGPTWISGVSSESGWQTRWRECRAHSSLQVAVFGAAIGIGATINRKLELELGFGPSTTWASESPRRRSLGAPSAADLTRNATGRETWVQGDCRGSDSDWNRN